MKLPKPFKLILFALFMTIGLGPTLATSINVSAATYNTEAKCTKAGYSWDPQRKTCLNRYSSAGGCSVGDGGRGVYYWDSSSNKCIYVGSPSSSSNSSSSNSSSGGASSNVCDSKASKEVKEAAGCPGYNTATENQFSNVIINIINGVIAVAGIIAVIFVVVGGVQYMTSTGDPGKIKKAKDTILYAIIGLIVCALAFAIVNFAIGLI